MICREQSLFWPRGFRRSLTRLILWNVIHQKSFRVKSSILRTILLFRRILFNKHGRYWGQQVEMRHRLKSSWKPWERILRPSNSRWCDKRKFVNCEKSHLPFDLMNRRRRSLLFVLTRFVVRSTNWTTLFMFLLLLSMLDVVGKPLLLMKSTRRFWRWRRNVTRTSKRSILVK